MQTVVEIGHARFRCEMARTMAEQARGLQGQPPLERDRGLFFPFASVRSATFHAGTVDFSFDIIFVDGASRVARIVHEVQPGSKGTWSYSSCSAVVELAGGVCRSWGLSIGAEVKAGGRRIGQLSYDRLKTLSEPGPDYDESKISPAERWNDRNLPDEGPDAMDQPGAHWEQNIEPYGDDDRFDAVTRAAQGYSVELNAFVPALVEGAARTGVTWQPLVLNDKRERAVVTPADVGRWLHALNLPEEQLHTVHELATSAQGMDLIGSGFIAAEMAETANVSSIGHENILVLTRRKDGPVR